MARQARDRSPRSTSGCASSQRGDRHARWRSGAPCAAPASSARAAPGSCRTGPAIAPTAFCRKASCSAQLGVVADHDARRRPCRSGRSGTWWSSARRCRSRAPAAAGSRGWRRCCRRRRARPRLRASAAIASRSTSLQQRIGRRLDPDHAGSRAGSPPRRRARSVRSTKLNVEPGRAPAHLLEQPEACRHRGRRWRRRGRRRRAARAPWRSPPGPRRRRSRRVPLSRSAMQRSKAMRVGFWRARVFVALVHAGALLRVGRGGVDRHHHRAGRRVGLWPAWMRARREGEAVACGVRLMRVCAADG